MVMPIYDFRTETDGGVTVTLGGDPVVTLKGGCAEQILLTYASQCRRGQLRGNDYLAGVIQGMTHMAMLPPEARPVPKPSGN